MPAAWRSPRVTGWNFYVVLLVIVVGVGAYSIHGGLTSVMWADLFQCILLMVGGITLFFAGLGPDPRRLGRDGGGQARSGCTSTSRPTTRWRPSWE